MGSVIKLSLNKIQVFQNKIFCKVTNAPSFIFNFTFCQDLGVKLLDQEATIFYTLESYQNPLINDFHVPSFSGNPCRRKLKNSGIVNFYQNLKKTLLIVLLFF